MHYNHSTEFELTQMRIRTRRIMIQAQRIRDRERMLNIIERLDTEPTVYEQTVGAMGFDPLVKK